MKETLSLRIVLVSVHSDVYGLDTKCGVCVCVCVCARALVQARPHVHGSEDNIQEWILFASQTLNLRCQACKANTFAEPNILQISTVKLAN